MGASAKIDHDHLLVDPGGEVRGQVTVRNTGAVVDQFSLEVLGDAAGWATIEPAILSLFPGAEGMATFVIRPPRLWSTRPGPVALGLRAASKEDPAGSVVEEAMLEIGTFSETSAEVSPRTSHGRFGAIHEIAVDNRGNVPVEAAVAGSDEDRQLKFETVPPSTIVESGSVGIARLRVRPNKRFWRGPARTRRFQVAVEPVKGRPIALEGVFLHDAILPSWILPALGALLALAVLALFFWFAFLRPAVENAAGQKAAQVLNSAGIPVPSAGAPSSGGGGSASPGASPPGGKSSPTGPGPTDGRLTPTTPITIAAGQTLHITDLIFGNPDGASGSLDLVRNGTILLDLRLDNFRELDYHFVTPIQVEAGETLQLNASCAPGCTPSVFYTGFVSVP
jgi:hypothetical protein